LENSDPGLAVGEFYFLTRSQERGCVVVFTVEDLNNSCSSPIGYQSFSNLKYAGTFYVDTEEDNDFIGIVFGYQSSSKFYAATWKKAGQVYWDRTPFFATSATGMTIKVRSLPKLQLSLFSTRR
jgi:hypothetical protein